MSWPGWEKYHPDETSTASAPVRRVARIKGAQPVVIDGHLFPSRHEARRYQQLRLEEDAKLIADLRLQVRFPLEVNGIVIAHWRADFTYRREGHLVVEDAKGWRTELYRRSKAHFEAQYGIQIHEV